MGCQDRVQICALLRAFRIMVRDVADWELESPAYVNFTVWARASWYSWLHIYDWQLVQNRLRCVKFCLGRQPVWFWDSYYNVTLHYCNNFGTHKDKIPFCAEHIHGGGTVKVRSTKALVCRFELLITEL